MELSSEQLKRLQQQFDFIREIDKEKEIIRQTPLADNSRKEDDAEHAWHMAVMTLILSEYATEPIDVLHTISILLVHDLVEIYAGDTYAYDEAGKETQKARETDAADRLYALLPEDQRDKVRGLWDEFEEGSTPEARFAHAMDNLQPLVLNDASGGTSWKEHEVHIDQVLERNRKTASGSEILWQYCYDHFIKPALEKGILKPARS